ncbi:RNA polymerase subunit sigma [Bacillus solimangrovi]|uniref:RNA polymerase subunit sigma n=1 Tax=Bacillus solimangrovi TaxID=1305675 RepID=A0A1E5LJJ5_9BACI|nr:RNA polymerase sigma factor [Bacillus solimangrovi]OEH94245.1 RNA polymerase subunit sigma [Bacillus solimangrovi]
MLTDKELVQEIQSGNQEAMEVLVKRHYKTVYAFVYRKIGDKHTSYDLTQEVFIKMMKNINSYTQKAAFQTWLLTIAVNHCRDYFRSKAFQQSSKTDEFEESFNTSSHDDIAFIFEKNENRQKIKNAISELPEYQSEAILLKYFHDLKIKEIAEVTNSNVSTVKSRLKQGLAKLRMILDGSGSFEQ